MNLTLSAALSPIVLFVYNRQHHTIRTVSSLQNNDLASESDLFVFSDGPKHQHSLQAVRIVREYIKGIQGFRSIQIVERDTNWGLAKSVIEGVSQVIDLYGKVIVIEDDVVTARHFLRFMNEALNTYSACPEIMSITGLGFPVRIPVTYMHDVYLSCRSSSWGWGTWKDRWSKVDWSVGDFESFMRDPKSREQFNQGGSDLAQMLKMQMEGKIDSWAIRWCYSHFRNHAYCLFPRKSLVQNIGFDNTGTHCTDAGTAFDKIVINDAPIPYDIRLPEILEPDEVILRNFRLFIDQTPSVFSFWIHALKRWLLKLSEGLKILPRAMRGQC